jgi:hypothetical protein
MISRQYSRCRSKTLVGSLAMFPPTFLTAE